LVAVTVPVRPVSFVEDIAGDKRLDRRAPEENMSLFP
jgi:hypothetical protein